MPKMRLQYAGKQAMEAGCGGAVAVAPHLRPAGREKYVAAAVQVWPHNARNKLDVLVVGDGRTQALGHPVNQCGHDKDASRRHIVHPPRVLLERIYE